MAKKTVLITGASWGIGRVTTEILEETNSYNILVPNRSELELTDSSSIDGFLRRNSNIDIIINNAGINNIDYIQDVKDEDIRFMLLTNVVAPIKLIRGIVPHMMGKYYGRIVNISSIWGITSKEKRIIYSATKFGINDIKIISPDELLNNYKKIRTL